MARQNAKFWQIALLCLGLGLLPQASRAEGVAFQLSSGMSWFRLKAASDAFDRDGGFGLEIRPQLGFEFPNLNVQWSVFYQGRIGSTFSEFPINRLGSGLQYYPLGMPMRRSVLDSGVVVTENRFSPFVTGAVTMTVLSGTDPTQGTSFNALTFGYQLGVGAEHPVTTTLSANFMALYDGTLIGGSASRSSTLTSLSAVSFLIGITYRP